MSFYEERLNTHQVHNTLSTLKTRIEKLISEQFVEDVVLEHLIRLINILSYTETSLKLSDPEKVAESTINQINKICDTIAMDLDHYDNDKNINHLIAANTPKADNILIHLQQLPKTIPEIDYDEHKEVLSNLSKSIFNVIGDITKERDEFKKKIDGYKNVLNQLENNVKQQNQNIENQKTRLDSAISQFQTQFSEAEDRRRESFENSIKTNNQEHMKFKDNIQNELNLFTQEKQKEVTQHINKFNEDAGNRLSVFKDDSNNALNTLKGDSDATMKYLSERKEEAKNLLNIIANIGSTGNYNKIATQEKIVAEILRVLAVIFMVAGIYVIGTVVFNISKTGFDWKLLLSRVGVTITIFIPAFYLARESSKHRQREIHNRKMELELASIGPYLELLPDDKKNELKATLTEKFFGQPEPQTDKSENVTAGALFKLLDRIVTVLAKK